MVKNLPVNAGDTKDMGSIPGSGRSPGEGKGNPLQYSCMENSMDRGAWRAIAHEVSKESGMTERTQGRQGVRLVPYCGVRQVGEDLASGWNPIWGPD